MEEVNPLVRSQAQRDWDRARQAATLEHIVGVFSSKPIDLLSFEDVQKSLRLNQKNYKGIQDIEIDRILGSVGRYNDFTRTFLPRKSSLRDRWQNVDAIGLARGLNPIEVYQVGEAYFVVDGNHRVSVARLAGSPTISAHVWEYPTATGLSAQADLDEVFIKAEYANFLERTKLDQQRPEQEIVFTAPGRYRELEYQIELFRQALEKIDGEPVTYEDAAAAWYDMIYTPACQVIEQRGILERFPGRTKADLFAWVWRYNQELKEQGIADLRQAADELGEQSGGPLRRLWQKVTGKRRPGTETQAGDE
jgi:hypothetical protein